MNTSLQTSHLEVLHRGHQSHYERAIQQIYDYEHNGDRVIWISDREPGVIDRSHRQPDLLVSIINYTHLKVALLITEVIARELVNVIMLEGPPLNFDQHYLRLRWICARYHVKLIILID